jgi:hypothetical protein
MCMNCGFIMDGQGPQAKYQPVMQWAKQIQPFIPETIYLSCNKGLYSTVCIPSNGHRRMTACCSLFKNMLCCTIGVRQSRIVARISLDV